MARFNMTYHGSPSAQSIMSQGFRPGGIMSVAPGQVFSTPNYGFASGYGKPVGMVTSKSAFSMPSMNFSTGNLGSEVVQSPKAATRGMNLANKLGTTYTSSRAKDLMSGRTVSGLGGSTPGNLMRALGIMGSLPAQAALMSLSPTPANADEINMGPEDFANLANAEVTPQTYSNIPELTQLIDDNPDINSLAEAQEYANQNRPNMSDIAGLGDLGNPTGDSRVVSEEMGMTGTPNFGRPSMADIAGQVNENLIDRGNPFNDSRVVSEEQSLVGGIPDRNRGMPGAPTGAYEMIGGTPVAIGDVLGRQQALEKADFYEETPQGMNYDLLGTLGTLGGLLTGSTALKGLGMFGNYKSGRTGRALGSISRGLGSLGNKFAGSMRGINPITGRPNTQAQYEQDRADRQAQSRTDSMIDRIANNKTTRSNPRDAGTTQAQKDAISEAIQDRARTGQYDNDGGGSGGSSKIVCTMMNERYGFGSFRNKIWMKFHESHGPEYQKGYHAIFLPLVKIAKGEGKINTAVRKVLEHMGRHVTADMFKIMKGKKRDTLGRIYRAIFEPACHIIGKIKSALGRG